MTKEKIAMLRTWIMAQIEAQINDREEDDSGYRHKDVDGHKVADELFERLQNELGL
jgi:hypothetical protein